ncbi:MAG: glycosyltransferase family 1 protein [Bacteroidetes bacterium QH_10_64_19]|nr:MAG: glycosyltransferase family 1 protein [Bacteroidetes bacterium QH_10_64_19]
MRLLFVTQDFPPDVGGIQTYSWEVAHRLADRVEHLAVMAPEQPNAAPVDRTVPFSIHRLPGRSDLLLLSLLPALPACVWRFRPHVVFHAQWQTVGASILARSLFGWPRRIVCAAHGRELLFNPATRYPGLGAAYDRLRQTLLHQVDAFLPVSHYTAGLLHERGVPPSRTHVVPNGTDPTRFRPHDGTQLRQHLDLTAQPLLLTVGRLVRRKGIDTVLRALPTIIQTCPDVAYVIAGTGPDRPRLERLAACLGVRDRLCFVGDIGHDRLPLYYSAADLFVMPARQDPPDVEGFGLVFLEANACGTPVVGAATGGIPEAIRDGETGLLVPPDAPGVLADAARRLLANPGLANTLGQQGRERVLNDANWDHVADRLFETLSS